MKCSYTSRILRLASVILAIAGAFPLTVAAQQTANQLQQPKSQSKVEDPKRSTTSSDSMDMDSPNTPMLGVRIQSTPGCGVYVESSIWGSPAQEAGIRSGDYITYVNDAPVASPSELRSALSHVARGNPVRVTIWRNNQTFVKEAKLAQLANEIPESHRTWLGVVLTPSTTTGGTGVEVSYVFPDSPAEQAGLQSGDVIVTAGDHPANSIGSLVQCMEKHGPESGCELNVRRDGELRKVQLRLGDLDTAPDEWLINAYRAPIDATDWSDDSNSGLSMGTEAVESLQQLRNEVRELRQKIDRMDKENVPRLPAETPSKGSAESNDASDRTDNGGGRGPTMPVFDETSTALVTPFLFTESPSAQQNWRGRPRWNSNRPYPQDRQYFYYGYPDYVQGRYPYYDSWYYNYGGQRYYYPGYTRGNYYYGPRYGIRVGPDWGVYWY